MEEPEDEYYAAGLYVLGLLPASEHHKLAKHIRATFVKIFFYQFMLTAALWQVNNLVTTDVAAKIAAEPFGFLSVVIDSLFLIDIAFAAVGYLLTLRLFDSHIRTVEPTVLGWLVCLICYSTFYDMFYDGFVAYNDGYYWGQWLSDSPILKGLWAVPVVGLLAIYSFATVQFGIRFSNLTHRGIITNGPYRFSKHPAYLSKNVFWWFVTIPFISADGGEVAVKHCLMLAAINLIYYYRAKTEERHLSLDPVYREYAAWIAQHGLIARVKRLIGLETPPYKVPLRPIVGEPNPYEKPAAGE
jgi:protein-S-isoprenylcysteine O-methyltransferase Ste14